MRGWKQGGREEWKLRREHKLSVVSNVSYPSFGNSFGHRTKV